MPQKDKQYQNYGETGETFQCNCALKYCLDFSDQLKIFPQR